ncbi:hypothetical protein TUM19329_07630 [Legionella antarctica]|uniref:Uncharacterized protein n=1 Tax=Legionella antarctica TaxID=2708020 RepID=A0A6F8T307_9GAMM|nr:hypothetical protein [Legionella antarctica]BCA94402.1 hypothetical protein TUM19329_07630 [Legionella antarctica]
MCNPSQAISSYTQNTADKVLSLSISNYPGGVAIWGALPAVFDTKNQEFDRGVHVHARKNDRSQKSIDATYSKVEVEWQGHVFEIDESAAVHFTMASIFDITISSLTCNYCHSSIISTGIKAVIPGFIHVCQVCGMINETNYSCVINPVIALKNKIGDPIIKRKAFLPKRSIILTPDKYPGGIQLWGSNPSILWTSKRLEESAIHVHAYNACHKRIVDNTYSQVIVNGEYLNIEMIRVLQIQKAVPNLTKDITTVYCPVCDSAQFDTEMHAVIAHTTRVCQKCSRSFEHPKAISNPALHLLKTIQENGIPHE